MPGGVLALWPDLMFSTRMQDAGRRLGIAVVVTQRVEELIAQAQIAQPVLIILDLETPGLAIGETVTTLRAAQPQAMIVAVGTHVEGAPRTQAQAAGAQIVMVRSEFSQQLLALLTRYGS